MSNRSILRQYPELRHGGWREIAVPNHLKAQFPGPASRIKKFLVSRSYSVQVYYNETDWGQVIHLLVRRHDQLPIRSWTALQEIKDDICGPESTAIEVFPARSDLVDQANLYHLWVLPPDMRLPFGLHMDTGGLVGS